jgi:serine/threonine protein kinase
MPFPTSVFVQSGRFTHVREIGQGAFGKVYYANDNLGRSVAVKEALPSNHFFQDARIRFEKESRIQAALQHQNIISVYSLEEDQQTKELYLICEYMNGGSLADYLNTHGRLTEQQTIKIGLDLCSALDATWGEQIVHRDIKPSNILLKLDANGIMTSAKIGDFGIAQDKKGTRTTMRQGASHPGTPLYMAPEQSNSANILDVRADIYALGITLWEILTGVDYKPLCNQTHNPSLQQYAPTASAGIATIIQKAVRDDPIHRYPTPQQMADDLNAVRIGKQPLTPTLRATPIPSSPAAQTIRITSQPPLRQSRLKTVSIVSAVLFSLGLSLFFIPTLLGRSNQNTGVVIATTAPSISEFTPISTSAPVSDVTTPLPTEASVPVPTATTAPPSATPEPTNTPVPTATTVPPSATPEPTNTPVPTVTTVPPSATPVQLATQKPNPTPLPTAAPKISTAEEYLKLARDARKKKDVDGAMAALAQAIKLKPAYAAAYAQRGDIYMRVFYDHNAAITDFSAAIRFAPTNSDYIDDNGWSLADYFQGRAWNYYGKGDAERSASAYKQCIADTEQALAINPKYSAATRLRGYCQEDLATLPPSAP